MKRWLARAAAFVRAEFVVVAAGSLASVCLLAFIGVAEALQGGEAHAFDMAVLQALHPDAADRDNPLGPDWLDRAVADISALGSVSVLLALSLGAAGFLVLTRRPVGAVTVAASFLGALALSEGLKMAFGRDRPPEAWRAAETLNASFPSGHALISAAVFLVLGAMLARAVPSRALRIYVVAVALVLTLLVGFTRIHLGVHWATDVFAGWSVGAAWAALCWLGGHLVALRLARRS